MPAPNSIVDVTGWRLAGVEPTGRAEKFWLIDPEDNWPWLFKPAPDATGAAGGADWAEVVAAELASLVGLPHPVARVACRGPQRGCVVRKFTAQNWELQPGSSLLSEVVPNFDAKDRDRHGHSLHNIQRVLAPLSPPPDTCVPSGLSAFSVFAGYLVFDALIANQDRHSNNWGVLRPPPGESPDSLAPSFDHGSSLGFNVPEAQRVALLARGSVPQWARRGWAREFERPRGSPRVRLSALATMALSQAQEAAGQHWLARTARLDRVAIETAVSSVPGVSEATGNFITQLVLANREVILDDH